MIEKGNIETFFTTIDESTIIIQNELNITYLDALILTGQLLFQGNIHEPLSDISAKKLKKNKVMINIENFTKEQIRKTFQLAILKEMKEGAQAHHAMTPDAVALFMSYLVNKLTEKLHHFRLLDPTVGSGNLLTAILNSSNKQIESFGIEPDETLLKLAYVNANLQQHNIELFHQDCLTNIFIDHVDMVVSDLPVGYYPNDDIAKRFELKAENGLSYTHHLIIEQMINCTKQGGFLLFLIPNNMFETNQAKQLHHYIKEHAHIYSLIQLPKTLFKEEKSRKSIFILRKKGIGIQPPNQALLAELPSFSHKQSLTEMINSMNNWFDLHL